jgi:4-hydroxy-3-methylbut-2-enyl diphosphate reductase IspH
MEAATKMTINHSSRNLSSELKGDVSLRRHPLPNKARIGITGGTSTPEIDLEEVRDRIYALTAA